jgi:hypothetical protein
MINSSPIPSPPPELVLQWDGHGKSRNDAAQILATQAARWGADQQLKLDAEQIAQAYQAGADQELEACCKWLEQNGEQWKLPYELRASRRPKPPSLKEQALESVKRFELGQDIMGDIDTLRRALEALPND